MGFLKEKSAYRPTRFEIVAAWAVTIASGLVVVAFLVRAWAGRS